MEGGGAAEPPTMSKELHITISACAKSRFTTRSKVEVGVEEGVVMRHPDLFPLEIKILV